MPYLIAGCCVIVLLLGLYYKAVADERIKEVEESVERRAERRARQLVKEWLDGVQLQVTQRIVVVYDDLKKEESNESSNEEVAS